MATYTSNPPDMAISQWANGAYYFKHDPAQDPSDGSKSRFYELYDTNTNGLVGTGQYGIEIRYENSQNVIYCMTAGNNDTPRAFASNGATSLVLNSSAPTTVPVYSTSSFLYEGDFVVAVANLWVAGSSLGTGTVLVQDAKIVNYGGITGLRFEQRGYVAASYELTGPGGPYNWTVSTGSNNLQHHINQLAEGTYYLWTGGIQVATLVATLSKKVFCNFW